MIQGSGLAPGSEKKGVGKHPGSICRIAIINASILSMLIMIRRIIYI